MAFARWLTLVMALGVCSSGAAPDATPGASAPVFLENQGGELEGHTPRGFAGTGTGLFVGDNINPSFPDGDGVQAHPTFEPTGVGSVVGSAVLSSDAMVVRGSPFENLGPLTVEVVSYDAFGPGLFDLVADSPAVACRRVGETGVVCDVTEAVGRAADAGVGRLQFRLRFERAGDGDGRADLAMFFVTEPDINEPGIFTLTIG